MVSITCHCLPADGLGGTWPGPNKDVTSSPSGGSLSGFPARKLGMKLYHNNIRSI